MNTREAAAHLAVPARELYRLIDVGVRRADHAGRDLRLRAEEVAAFGGPAGGLAHEPAEQNWRIESTPKATLRSPMAAACPTISSHRATTSKTSSRRNVIPLPNAASRPSGPPEIGCRKSRGRRPARKQSVLFQCVPVPDSITTLLGR